MGESSLEMNRKPTQWAGLVTIGLVAGFLSGMFGVGGGILIVPGLVLVLHFGHRLASGTSLAAIVPLALVGVISYALNGSLSLVAALLVVLGSVVGAQIGTRLLQKIPTRPLQIGFAVFIVVVIVSLFLVVPTRGEELAITWTMAIALVILGIITGILSGLLGVGGGVIIVPALMLLFGASDLVARGTSLLIMIPTALAGTLSNLRAKNVDISAALAVGLPACVTTFLGSMVAVAVSPALANTLFAIFLVFVAAQMLWRGLKAPRH
ncbi:sulfite exporter TauE/SafE family protein [Actinomyces minihominis]|uniref:sulfite exporter TauE/SafE family protein n=1 Tax=Actinomyces minihominis TaxID=2002838 RepID=UPI001F5DE01D|nr:sulfite exporter TauE/SafE family protein [Actinomyces minihominis]